MEGRFGTIDFVFFSVYMIVVMVIGFWVGRREKQTVGDYFRAGNRLPWYAIGFSIIAAGISSEQFIGEIGYAYKLGMPVVNWDWLVFPALTILLWIFIPLYFRNRITTMPEYLERRFGPDARTLYAVLIILSYVFANFALVFFTGAFAMQEMWGINPIVAVWVLAITTGAYTIYGGLASVAWTDFFQCLLLIGGGIYVFFAGMAKIGWDFAAVIGEGQRAHLFAPADHPEVPWTAFVILALSTNVWYYATDQFINQRCLGAISEWHSKMGVLLACGIQLFLPLATAFPGMIYFVMNPNLTNTDAAYPSIVAAVVPAGFRGIVVAAVLGAIMSTISGLVNSTATMVTLDIAQRTIGKTWTEKKLVRFGQWAGGIALTVGAAFSIVVRNWDNMFRYCQDIWGPMAAPAVVCFLGGAIWKPARERGAKACLWLSILSVPYTFLNKYLQDTGANYMPGNLEQSAFFTNALVFSGAVFLVSAVLMAAYSLEPSKTKAALYGVIGSIPFIWISLVDTVAMSILIIVGFFSLTIRCLLTRKIAVEGMWDQTMLKLPAGEREQWWNSIWFWWAASGVCFLGIYAVFH